MNSKKRNPNNQDGLNQQIQTLAQVTEAPCISLYMPVYHAIPGAWENETRFRDLKREARQAVAESGAEETSQEAVLGRLDDLDLHRLFEDKAVQGVGIFMSPDFEAIQPLVDPVPERTTVADRLDLVPLIRYDNENQRALLLEIQQKSVRFFEVRPEELHERRLSKTITSIDGYLAVETAERHHQVHTGDAPTTHGVQSAVHHGQGNKQDAHKDQIKRFCQQIDKELMEFDDYRELPLILTGVEYVLTLFRMVTRHPDVHGIELRGDAETTPRSELHSAAREIMKTRSREDQNSLLDLLKEAPLQKKSTGDLSEILRLANEGRIEVLFVPEDQKAWGRIGGMDAEPEQHEQREPGDTELLCHAVTQTVNTSGLVITLDGADGQRSADGSSVGAILRY